MGYKDRQYQISSKTCSFIILIVTRAFEPITFASWWLLLPSSQDTNWFLVLMGFELRCFTRRQETLSVEPIGTHMFIVKIRHSIKTKLTHKILILSTNTNSQTKLKLSKYGHINQNYIKLNGHYTFKMAQLNGAAKYNNIKKIKIKIIFFIFFYFYLSKHQMNWTFLRI